MTNGDLRLETLVVDDIARTPYHGFAMLAYADLLHHGAADLLGRPLIYPSDSAIIAQIDGGLIVGIMTFDPGDLACTVVRLVYVLPDYRRRGIFSQMLEELTKWCERCHRQMIEFEVPIQNAAFGRTLVSTSSVLLGTGSAAVVTQCYRVAL